MVEESPIDNEILISLIEKKPVLWDKTMEMYKNRVATQEAWKEIISILNPNFETAEEKARQAYGKLIIRRWTHIRDNFYRYLKKNKDQKRSRHGAKTAKPYFYSKRLSFLLKVMKPNETVNNLMTENTESENQEDISKINEDSETNSETEDAVPTKSIPKRVAKRPLKNDTNVVDANMIKIMNSFANQEPKATNRHLSFFNGILPSLDNLDDNEVIEFQMGVLQLLKQIKNSRQNTSLPSKYE